MRREFLYPIAIIDWATRRVPSWRLSNTLTAGFRIEALSEALARFGRSAIFNAFFRFSDMIAHCKSHTSQQATLKGQQKHVVA
jgi:hypothetical protein